MSLMVMEGRSYFMRSTGFTLAYLFLVTELFEMGCGNEVGMVENLIFSEASTGLARKLLQSPDGVGVGDDMNRIGETPCSKDDISIFQGTTPPLPSGVPAYTVQILNACVSGCSIAGIHVTCGWFSSVRLVNPRVFRRLKYNDCLVNDGEPLGAGQTLSFQYANSFPYPLSVSSVAC